MQNKACGRSECGRSTWNGIEYSSTVGSFLLHDKCGMTFIIAMLDRSHCVLGRFLLHHRKDFLSHYWLDFSGSYNVWNQYSLPWITRRNTITQAQNMHLPVDLLNTIQSSLGKEINAIKGAPAWLTRHAGHVHHYRFHPSLMLEFLHGM